MADAEFTVSIRKAAAILGVSESHLYPWMRSGILPYRKRQYGVGRLLRRADVDALVMVRQLKAAHPRRGSPKAVEVALGALRAEVAVLVGLLRELLGAQVTPSRTAFVRAMHARLARLPFNEVGPTTRAGVSWPASP